MTFDWWVLEFRLAARQSLYFFMVGVALILGFEALVNIIHQQIDISNRYVMSWFVLCGVQWMAINRFILYFSQKGFEWLMLSAPLSFTTQIIGLFFLHTVIYTVSFCLLFSLIQYNAIGHGFTEVFAVSLMAQLVWCMLSMLIRVLIGADSKSVWLGLLAVILIAFPLHLIALGSFLLIDLNISVKMGLELLLGLMFILGVFFIPALSWCFRQSLDV